MTAATDLERRRAGSVEHHASGEAPLLLVHGFGGSAENWVEVVPELAQRYRVIAIDLPGHAGSGSAGPGRDDGRVRGCRSLGARGGGRRARGRRRPLARRPRGAAARTGPPTSSVGSLLAHQQGIATASRVVEALVIAAATIRPGRAVARFRHRWPTASGTGVSFGPGSSRSRRADRARHGGLLSAQALHTDTKIAGRAMIADDPAGTWSDRLPGRRPLGRS